MFTFKNRLATGTFIAVLVGALKVAFDIIYKVLKVLKLQLLLSVLFVGAILFLTKVIPENSTVFWLFIAFVALGFFYAVIGNMMRIKKFFRKYKKDKQEVRKEKEEKEKAYLEKEREKAQKLEEAKSEKENNKVIESQKEDIQKRKYSFSDKYPRYYAVSQNKQYVMAEYRDRYELYLKKDGKLFRVRTDLKKEFK